MASKTYTIELQGSPLELAALESTLNLVAKADIKDRGAITNFLQLATDDKDRIGEILKNSKAIKAIKDNWIFLKLKFA